MRFCSIQGCQHGVFRTDKNTRLGYCQNHWKQHSTDIDKDSIYVKAIKKRARENSNIKTISKLRNIAYTSDEQRKAGKEYDTLDNWFRERRKEMTGVCIECGKTTCKGDDKYYRWSICHVVPKSLIKSVATNEFNFVELCQQHHQEYDNTFDKAAAMMCFGEVKQKFQLFKHLIPPQEMRKINPHLLN